MSFSSQLAEAAISRRVATISDAEPPTNYSRHLIKSIQNRMASKYIQQFDLPFIHNVQCYEKLMKIGQGTFGLVAKIFVLEFHYSLFLAKYSKHAARKRVG